MSGVLSGLRLLAFAMRRVATGLVGIQRELKRIGDVLEAQSGSKGVSFRSFYRDEAEGAVDDAALFAQDDAEFAALEQDEIRKARAGGSVALEDEP